jgi:non-ribosomal peptide synthetase component F
VARHPSEVVTVTYASLLDGAFRHPEAPAAVGIGGAVDWRTITAAAERLAALLPPGPGPVALCTGHSPAALVAMAACLLAERPWYSLSPSHPVLRMRSILQGMPVAALVVEPAALAHGTDLAAVVSVPVIEIEGVDARWLRDGEPYPGPALPANCVCLCFTSGSTGSPRAVPLSIGNLAAFRDALFERYEITPGRTLSWLHELSSSAMLQNLLLALGGGARLALFRDRSVIRLLPQLRSADVDFVHIVPSAVRALRRLRQLRPGTLPAVRDTLIGGELVQRSVVSAWHCAAPYTVIANSYGPTEATVNIAIRTCHPDVEAGQWFDDVAPIGELFPGHCGMIAEPDGRPVPPGAAGELLVAGPQVASGYIGDPAATGDRFVERPGEDGRLRRWYRTGARVRRDERLGLTVIGRVDRQLSIQGYRVEPGEVEAVIRAAFPDIGAVAVVGRVGTDGAVDRLVAYIEGRGRSDAEVLAACRDRLPGPMVPHEVRRVDGLPLNTHGKVDQGALVRMAGAPDLRQA